MASALGALRVLAGSGLLRPARPDRLLGLGLGVARWGTSHASAVSAAAALVPDRAAVVDERGALSYAELDELSSAVARGLLALGVGPGNVLGLLARNSSGFVTAQVAAAKVGADLLYLNTGFAAPQLAESLDAERVAAVVADGEFAGVLHEAASDRPVVYTGADPAPAEARTLAGLADGASALRLPAVPRPPRHVILTSGTTGRPKGAGRATPRGAAGVAALVALLSAIPLRAGGRTVLAAPMFHAWGFLHLTLGLLLRSTLVVERRFDPAGALRLVERHRADALVAVPVMVQRMLELSPEQRAGDFRSLRVIALSGSEVPVELARALGAEFGPVLYDLYGSTEVAFVSVAGPRDFAEAPGSVGRPLPGVRVAVLDEAGAPVEPGGTGRVFAGTPLPFDGYTGGGGKERVGGLLSTGDLGHLDAAGRLWIDGRGDDMIVSGGENVFPGEVEECLRGHPAVRDVAVVGVPDGRFGARLVAYVVSGGEVGPEALRGFVRERLAGYKVPREVVLCPQLPRGETGKVLRRELVAARPAG